MEIRYYIGIDVSKATLDWAVFDGKTTVLQTQSPNSEKGIKTVLRLLKELPDFSVQFSIICLEHTPRGAPRYLQCDCS
jgi:predicted NBD/HSP70 family sugar kinase